MGGYGYKYESYSTYNTAGVERIEEPFASLLKIPFDPFVPNSSNRNNVPRRKQVPVTTADEYRHSSPTKVYRARDDDYEWHRPVHGRPEFLTKVQNEASRPAGYNPATTTYWHQRPHGANGYGDSGGSKEGHNHKPITRSDSYDDYHSDDGYGGNYSHKDHKPIARPPGNGIYDDNHDNSYGEEHSMGTRVFPKSKSPTDGYDNFNRDNGYGGNNYSNKEGHKPLVRNDTYDGYNRDINGGYGGNYGNKEGRKPIGIPGRNDSYDGYPPAGNYSGWNKPIRTAPPKQGTQLTEPTSDINTAIELLKNLSGNDGVDRPTKESERLKPRTTVAPPNSGYKQSEPSNNVGKKEPEKIKNVVTALPPQPRTTELEPTKPNKYDNNEDTKRFGNFTSPRRNIIDGRDEAYQRKGRYGDSGTITSKQAAIQYNGRLL